MNPIKDNKTHIYSIGKYNLNRKQFEKTLAQFGPLSELSSVESIKGPFDGKINSIYLFKKLQSEELLFRCRVSQAFRYEKIAKEKILYPFLDGTLTKNTPKLYERIKTITENKQGSYIFSTNKPPIVPVQDLHYYYEPSEDAKNNHNISGNYAVDDIIPPKEFPYIVTVKNFVEGDSFYNILDKTPEQENNTPSILSVFEKSGELLAKLHNTIQFDSFYDKITDIGGKKKQDWKDLFENQWTANMKDAQQYDSFKHLINPLNTYYEKNLELVEEDNEAVLFHNDYQTQNIIIAEDKNKSYNCTDKFKITGLIDFDNWRIGPRAQDFVKMEYWSIKNNKGWKDAFYRGYSKLFPITQDMKTRINLYKVLWFILVYAFEMDKLVKNEANETVDKRFPSAQIYIDEISAILNE